MPSTAEIDITDIVKPHYERGLEQGLEQGLERGAYQKTIEAAKRLKNKKMDVTFIHEITGLNKKKIEENRRTITYSPASHTSNSLFYFLLFAI